MKLQEAVKSCRDGNFVTHRAFDSSQSMHMYNNELYYEDGANLQNEIDWMMSEKLFEDGWCVKSESKCINKDKLKKMHEENSRYMLRGRSYEECIITEERA